MCVALHLCTLPTYSSPLFPSSHLTLTHTLTNTQNFCSTLLLSLADTNSPDSWSLETKALALTALRIFAREREATEPLTCAAGLRPIVELAELHSDVKESCFASGDSVPSGNVQGDYSCSSCQDTNPFPFQPFSKVLFLFQPLPYNLRESQAGFEN